MHLRLLILSATFAAAAAPAGRPFAITVVDEQSGRGVPMVELRTANSVRYYTDSAGVVVFAEPGLMGQTVFFYVSSPGYEFPADGFGYRGTALRVTEGGSAAIKIRRLNVAERLYRITGAGIYRDSVLVGRAVPTAQPLLNAQVFGSDSVVNAVFQGKIFWFWGDASRPGYPLGNFQVTGATSRLPGSGGLDPSTGIDLEYFRRDHGFAREMAPLPGAGPTWLSGLIPVRDPDGRERLFAPYAKIRTGLKVYQRGLVEWDVAKLQWSNVAEFPLAMPCAPGGHPFRHTESGVEYLYFAQTFPLVRVRAEPAALKDPAAYEAYTCLRSGTRPPAGEVERDGQGRLRYAWKRATPPVDAQTQEQLVRKGQIRAPEALLQLRDVETGAPVLAHSGSVCWNDYRRRWVLIAVQSGGTSFLGEVWYSEGGTPLGPWVYARKIVTHDRYSFYNPKQDPFFDRQGGRLIYFEGTYSNTFSGNPEATPRYDYNQIMYRLDLADSRLALPGPVYAADLDGVRLAGASASPAGGMKPIAFFAPDRAGAGMVPVYPEEVGPGKRRLRAGVAPGEAGRNGERAVFYALRAGPAAPPTPTVPLYEYREEGSGAPLYSTEAAIPGCRRIEPPVCRVWKNPYQREKTNGE
jgi:hypothetical protein